MASKSTPAKQKYDKAYNARPEQKKQRAERNAARREYEKAHGDLPSDIEIDHKRMIKDGGTNAPDNLRAVPRSKNRAWRKGVKNA